MNSETNKVEKIDYYRDGTYMVREVMRLIEKVIICFHFLGGVGDLCLIDIVPNS